MRRLALIFAGLVAIGAAIVTAPAVSEDGNGDGYLIRAFFDNAGFLVEDEEVRVAGANVGLVESVDVTQPGEPVTENGDDDPGKAVVVMRIENEAFQDFRIDGGCIIRPQSLLGEKFVECKPTEPRSAVSEPPAELEVIPEGEPGEGQRYLPLENNGKAVDIDLVNNIYHEPEVDKFRLILNDLGAGLGARGETLGEVIERANPALRETDKVLAILAEQNKGLARLAVDSDTILAPLAREKDQIAGFINNATITGEAAAERREDIEQGFVEFPPALEQIEATMVELRKLAITATPVAANLRQGAPSLTGMTEALGPFADAGTDALLTLGDAAEESGPDLVASRSLVRQLGELGEATAPGAKELNKVLSTLRRSGGRDKFYTTIVNLGSALNGYDSYGHFLRAAIQINNCTDISAAPVTGCSAKWLTTSSAAATALAAAANPASPDDIVASPFATELGLLAEKATGSGDGKPKKKKGAKKPDPAAAEEPGTSDSESGDAPTGDEAAGDEEAAGAELFDYLLEDG